MPSRRAVLGGTLALPALLALGWCSGRAAQLVAAARPPAAGTSTTRCAACGDPGHSMLDAACPARPQAAL